MLNYRGSCNRKKWGLKVAMALAASGLYINQRLIRPSGWTPQPVPVYAALPSLEEEILITPDFIEWTPGSVAPGNNVV